MFCKTPHVSIRNKPAEFLPGLAAHVFLNPMNPFGQSFRIRITILIVVDLLNQLLYCDRLIAWWINREVIAGIFEIPDQSAIETIKDHKMGLPDLGTFTGASAEHLFPKNA